jgi:mannose-6-phosphate isomerase-like protein (cupin superfamily)
VASEWHAGNAAKDGAKYRGWIVGHFIDSEEGPERSTKDLEVKWGVHPSGEARTDWTVGERRSTLLLLVEGRFKLDLSTGDSVTLDRQGDYVTWGPGTEHRWQAEEDSVVVTVRWPSLS